MSLPGAASAWDSAVAELASVEATFPPSPELTSSPSPRPGRSAKQSRCCKAHAGTSPTIALTNDEAVLVAGRSHGPDARRNRDRRALPAVRTSTRRGAAGDGGAARRGRLRLGERVRRSAAAVAYLLDRRDGWLPPVIEAIDGTEGLWLLAPAERLGSALQGALMVREGPARAADGCETGDWNHVDVYLTKTLDYRALLFTGSRFDGDALKWMNDRRSHVVTVGGEPAEAGTGVSASVHYPGRRRSPRRVADRGRRRRIARSALVALVAA